MSELDNKPKKDIDLKQELENQADTELKKELEKVNWSRYLLYGSIRIQIREGKKTLTAIERTYPD